jgi:hypothetical protein
VRNTFSVVFPWATGVCAFQNTHSISHLDADVLAGMAH